MKKIGIVGGIGWPSTIEYYKLICESSLAYHKEINHPEPLPTPEIAIESLNMSHSISHRGSAEPGSWKEWDAYFNTALKRLEYSGCELILISSVTPHARLEHISQGVTSKILSVYESVAAECNKRAVSKLLVLGTLPTMTNPSFMEAMETHGISAIYPSNDSIKTRVANVISYLYKNERLQEAKAEIESIVMACLGSAPLDNFAVCLACTELPLAFNSDVPTAYFRVNGIAYINATVAHARYAFESCVT